MRITRNQLRRIVGEEARRLREVRGDEGGYNQHKINRDRPEMHPDVGDAVDLVSEVAPFVAEAVALAVDSPGPSRYAKEALDRMIDAKGEDGLPVPARIDDIESWAEDVTQHALQEPALYDAVFAIATSLLHKLTQPRGT